jgi:hypothetical protein
MRVYIWAHPKDLDNIYKISSEKHIECDTVKIYKASHEDSVMISLSYNEMNILKNSSLVEIIELL